MIFKRKRVNFIDADTFMQYKLRMGTEISKLSCDLEKLEKRFVKEKFNVNPPKYILYEVPTFCFNIFSCEIKDSENNKYTILNEYCVVENNILKIYDAIYEFKGNNLWELVKENN